MAVYNKEHDLKAKIREYLSEKAFQLKSEDV